MCIYKAVQFPTKSSNLNFDSFGAHIYCVTVIRETVSAVIGIDNALAKIDSILLWD